MLHLKSVLAALAVLVLSTTLQAGLLGTAFTYQGTLKLNGTNVTDMCNFEFGLWDALVGGAEVATAIDLSSVTVEDGVFTVELDFGGGVFDGNARWLEIAVVCPPGGGLTALAPRQPLTPAPHAHFAVEAGSMDWTGLSGVPPDIADGDDVDDADPDPNNELQDLDLSGNTLSLSDDPTPVDLSGYAVVGHNHNLQQILGASNDAGGITITNLPTPVADSDASTKAYVDSQGGAQDLLDVLTQGNDAGGITVTNLPAPVADSDASTKAYVDSQGGAQDLLDVLTQGNDAGGITITNLPAPVAGSDAATRTYVDAHVDGDSDPGNELQDLDLSGNTLSLTGDASPVDLTGYLDNTDDQTLDLTADQLSIESGNSVDLSGYLDDTDDQTLAEVLAQGNDAGGTSISNIDTTTTNALTISGLNCSVNANGGALTTNASGVVSCSDDDVGGGGGGNTLDQAYDQGGAGAGRAITADSGAVTIDGTDGLTLDTGSLLQLAGDPALIGSLGIGSEPVSVYVSGRYAYVIDQTSSDLKVIDVTDPGAPSLVGSTGLGLSPESVYVSGRYAYVTDSASNDLKILDVSDPSAPGVTGSLGIGEVPRTVQVSGRYAYVIDGISDDLKIIDVSDPGAPSLAGSLGGINSPESLYVSGRHAYVSASGSTDLKIIDVSDPTAPSLSGSLVIGGAPRTVYVSGRYAYVVDLLSDDLKVIDVSDPGAPTLTGSLPVGPGPLGAFVSGRYAFVIDRFSDDLKVIDVSDPALPLLAGSLGIGAEPRSIYVSGRHAYVVDLDSDDLKVIDLSGGELTSLTAHSLEAGQLQVRNDMIAQGQLQVTGGLNVGAGGVLSDGDVGVDGKVTITGADPLTLTSLDCTANTNGGALTVDADGVVSCSDDDSAGAPTLAEVLAQGNDAGGTTITNLPAPAAASQAATMAYVDAHVDADADPVNEIQDLDLSANTLSLTSDASPVDLSGYLDNTDNQVLSLNANTLELTSDDGSDLVDLSGYLDDTDDQTLAEVLAQGNDAGGTSISNIGTATTTALTISGLNCTGNANGGALTANASGIVSCSDDDAGLAAGNTLDQAYDQGGAGAGRTITADSGAVTIEGADGLTLDTGSLLQEPGNPVLAGSVAAGGSPLRVYVSGRYAYVLETDSDSLLIFDVSDTSAPSLVGVLMIGPTPISIFVAGRYAYVTNSTSGHLIVIDVSDPSAPSLAGSLAIGTSPVSVYVSGRYAYVVDFITNDLRVIDVSDPSAPSLAGRLIIGTSQVGIFVSGRYAYSLDQELGELNIIDVSDPTSPSLVSNFGIGSSPNWVYVSGRYAYIVDVGSQDLKVIDVSDPSTPSLAGSLVIGPTPVSVYVSGRYAYVTEQSSGELVVVDVTDATAPSPAGALSLGSTAIDVRVSGRYAYAVHAATAEGLKVFDVSGAEVTSMMAHSLEAGNLQVRNDVIAQGQLQVTGGLNAGNGGIFSDGDVGVAGNVSAIAQETGIFGQTDATVGATIGAGFADSQVAGVYGTTSVSTASEVIHGVVGETRSSVGGGVYASNRSPTSSTAPDLVLGITDYGDGGDNGIISSEPSDDNSDIFLHAMDTVVVRLNQDGAGTGQSTNSRFEVTYTPSGGSANRIFFVNHQGNVFADGSYNCGNSINDAAGDLDESELAPCLVDDFAADFAEMLPARGDAQPGDVLVTGPDGTLSPSWNAYSGNVVGVYSTRPSYLGNARKQDDKDHVPLAVSGIVPVKASAENGPIRAGDLLTSSASPGHAMRCEGLELCFGRVIGKALEPLPAGMGSIRILVSLN